MEVRFNKDQTPDLSHTIREILDFVEGKTQSVDLRNIKSAISELEYIERHCEEVTV